MKRSLTKKLFFKLNASVSTIGLFTRDFKKKAFDCNVAVKNQAPREKCVHSTFRSAANIVD